MIGGIGLLGDLGTLGALVYAPGGSAPPVTDFLTNDDGSVVLTDDTGTDKLTPS